MTDVPAPFLRSPKVSETVVKSPPDVAAVSADLQRLQRQRAVVLKSRNMQANRLQAVVAGTLGYSASMPEKDRLKKFAEASALIKGVAAGTADHPLKAVITTTLVGIDAFNVLKDGLEKDMTRKARALPVAGWVGRPEQRGFGLLFLAIVVGEAGDLAGYPRCSGLWRRMGCAPWTFDDKTLMGATWRSGREGKLPAAEWENYGYSPRRRSIAYLIGEGLVKQNGPGKPQGGNGDDIDGVTEKSPVSSRPCGPYRARYDAAKAALKSKHPEYPDMRCHLHGMLLATKLLLKNLWVVWNRKPDVDPRWARAEEALTGSAV
jgi:hypothetical protein